MTKVRFDLALRLVSEANAHEHYRVRSTRAQGQRETAQRVARQSFHAQGQSIEYPLRVTICRVSPRDLDSDNLQGSAKHVRDGIADFFEVKDNDPRVDWRVIQRRGDPKQYAVEVVIETWHRCRIVCPCCHKQVTHD